MKYIQISAFAVLWLTLFTTPAFAGGVKIPYPPSPYSFVENSLQVHPTEFTSFS